MRVRIYGAQADEKPFYESVQDAYGFSFTFAPEILTEQTAGETRGFDAVLILTSCKITRTVAKLLHENGVRFIAARSAGFDHIDLDACRDYGLRAANVPFYAPEAIAEHSILLALTLLRKLPKTLHKVSHGDYTMTGLKGRQLGSLTAGVLGTGRIGRTTIGLLHGFGCKVLAYDLYPNEALSDVCTYVSQEEVLRQADILFLHCPLTAENTHLISAQTLALMKPGAYLINAARGGLVDAAAVLGALEQGQLAGFGFDVYENERDFVRKNLGHAPADPVFQALYAREDVCFTPHVAFYTDRAVENMIRVSLDNLQEFAQTGACKNEVTTHES